MRRVFVLAAFTLGLIPLSAPSAELGPLSKSTQRTSQSANQRPCSELPGLKRIQSKGTPPIEIYYNEGQEELAKQVLPMAEQAEEKLKRFFGASRHSAYQIFLAKDNAQFSQLTGVQYDWNKSSWVVGRSITENDNVIRDPSLWDSKSREYTKLSELIAHEMTHSFSMALSGTLEAKTCMLSQQGSQPGPSQQGQFWFFEGLATLLSGQLASWGTDFKFNFEKYPRFELIMRPSGGYVTAATAVEYLLDIFGREKILDAVRRIPANSAANLDESNRLLFDSLALHGEIKALHEKNWKEATLKKYAKNPNPCGSSASQPQ